MSVTTGRFGAPFRFRASLVSGDLRPGIAACRPSGVRGESLLGNRLVAAHPGSPAVARRLGEFAGQGARKLARRKWG